MLTEFEVRRRIQDIRASHLGPLRKARMLLKLGQSLDVQMQSLLHAKAQLAKSSDRTASAGLLRLAQRTEMLHEDVRDLAESALRLESGSLN